MKPLTPVSPTERIVSLDVLRGVAIFGILVVNIAFFSGSLATMMNPPAMADQPLSEQLAWGFVKVFAEFKFVSLFSLLFGIGMVVQLNRARHRGHTGSATYIRRLLILLVIGLVHGLLLWYGDILAMYAVGGFFLYLLRDLSSRALLVAACVTFFIATVAYMGMQAFGIWAGGLERNNAEEIVQTTQDTNDTTNDEAAVVLSQSDDDRWERWKDALSRWADAEFNVTDESWDEVERIAFGEGPLLAALLTRLMLFVAAVVISGIFSGFVFRVLAMFLLGAALMKMDFFNARHRSLHLKLFVICVPAGLVMELACAALYAQNDFQMTWTMLLAETIHWFGSFILMLGYVGAICTLVHSGIMAWLQSAVGAVGRMALTNYLMQTVIATSIMYWWGLGLFGTFTRVQQLMLVLAIIVGQTIFSIIWMRLFQFGPMEWLWRSLVYLKRQPMRR